MSGHDLEDPLKLPSARNLAVALKELTSLKILASAVSRVEIRDKGPTKSSAASTSSKGVESLLSRAIAHPPNRFKQQISRNGGQLNHSLSFENGRVRKDKKTAVN